MNEILGGGGFHHIALSTKDIDASIKFYTEILGFKETISWGEGKKRIVMLDSGDNSCLELFADGVDIMPEGVFKHVALRTKDVRKVFERVKNADVTIITEPKDVVLSDTNATIAFFKGLDGEIIELFQNN